MSPRLNLHFSEQLELGISMFVPVSGKIKKATEKAVLISLKHTETEHWVPRSCIEGGNELEPGDSDFSVAEWFLEKNDIPA